MKYFCFFPGLLLVASLAYLTQASPRREPQELSASKLAVLAISLPSELRQLYETIINPYLDDTRKEEIIWLALEVLDPKKYKKFEWFFDWLYYLGGFGYGPGRRTPHHGGRTRGHHGHRGHGGRTPGGRHGGPGGRTPGGRHGGPGGRTPGGRKHHGRH